MFTKLIASSMHADKQDAVHPSFVEVIKQLSPFDAHILKTITDCKWGISSILAYEVNENKAIYQRNYVVLMESVMPFPQMDYDNCSLFSAGLENLKRLSIINIDHDKQLFSKERYDPMNEHHILDEYRQRHNRKIKGMDDYTIELRHGLWVFTEFGQMFLNCCL
ncbi:hypothetical protein D3C75_918860 [compost metagenome]